MSAISSKEYSSLSFNFQWLIGHYLYVQKFLEFSFVRESVTHLKSLQGEEFKNSVINNYTGQKSNF